jgi:hypothetical protein
MNRGERIIWAVLLTLGFFGAFNMLRSPAASSLGAIIPSLIFAGFLARVAMRSED